MSLASAESESQGNFALGLELLGYSQRDSGNRVWDSYCLVGRAQDKMSNLLDGVLSLAGARKSGRTSARDPSNLRRASGRSGDVHNLHWGV